MRVKMKKPNNKNTNENMSHLMCWENWLDPQSMNMLLIHLDGQMTRPDRWKGPPLAAALKHIVCIIKQTVLCVKRIGVKNPEQQYQKTPSEFSGGAAIQMEQWTVGGV